MQRFLLVSILVLAGTRGVAHGDDKTKALALFEKSDKAYKAGKFEDAVRLLEDAYKLYPEPILLYNLGRAQEGLGDVPGAIASYERYLREANQITDRGAIERRIATLRAQQAARDTEAKRLADEETRRKQAEAQSAEEADRRRREAAQRPQERSPVKTYGPWITMAAGGAIVATGIVFGIHASSTHDDAVGAPVQRDALELQHSAERSATIANVLYVAGGLAIAGGIGWKIYQWRTAEVTITPASVAVGGTW